MRARCNRCTMTFRVEEPGSYNGGEEHSCSEPECGLQFNSRGRDADNTVIVSVTPAEAQRMITVFTASDIEATRGATP